VTTWKARFLSNYFVYKWIMLSFVDHCPFVLFFWPLCCLFFFHLRILIKPFGIFYHFFCVENFISKIITIQSAALYLIVTSLQKNDEGGWFFLNKYILLCFVKQHLHFLFIYPDYIKQLQSRMRKMQALCL
jgi:hypothetical protein